MNMTNGLTALLWFGVILALIPLSLWLLKRTPMGGAGSGPAGTPRPVAQLPLSTQHKLVTVEVGQGDDRRRGIRDEALGRRHGLHWVLGGVAYFLTALPMFVHGASNDRAASFLLTTGIVYGLAGVHLERPLLWCGLLAFGGYAALVALSLPYAWTLSGVLIAACLVLAAVFAARVRAAEQIGREQAQ